MHHKLVLVVFWEQLCVLPIFAANQHYTLVYRQAELGIANKGGADWNKICPAHVRPEAENIDISVLKQLVEEERYLEFNMYFDRNVQLSRLIERLSRIREGLKNQGWGWDHAAIVQDYCRGTLLVMATKGTGTHCHVNWTEACNIAFSWEASFMIHMCHACLVRM